MQNNGFATRFFKQSVNFFSENKLGIIAKICDILFMYLFFLCS